MKVLFAALCALALVSPAAQAKSMKAPAKPAANAEATATTGEKPLFERLGGTPAITAVVDDFVGRAATNPKVNFLRDGKYAKIDVAQLKVRLVQFISMATGGPSKYEGRDMKTAHAGMKIKSSEFDALAGDLSASLDKFKVPAKEKGELMTIAASTKPAMVEVQ